MEQNQGTHQQNRPSHDNPAKSGQNTPPGSKTGGTNPQNQQKSGQQTSHSGSQK
jgi:hypothetical protein